MPFTFSHPAIVLPLSRWQSSGIISLTGLIIGSMSPDFEYFIRMKIQSHYSHSLAGIFLFNLPVSLLVAFIFHHIIRNPLIANLPLHLRSRFACYIRFNWHQYLINHYIVSTISILIGVVSHLLWDSLTHQRSYFVETLPILQSIITFYGIDMPIFKILQHASSILGLGFIVLFIYKMPSTINQDNSRIDLCYWLLVLLITSAVLTIRTLLSPSSMVTGNIVASIIMAFFIALSSAPLIARTLHKQP